MTQEATATPKENRNDRRNQQAQDLGRRASTRSIMQGHRPKSSNSIIGPKGVKCPNNSHPAEVRKAARRHTRGRRP